MPVFPRKNLFVAVGAALPLWLAGPILAQDQDDPAENGPEQSEHARDILPADRVTVTAQRVAQDLQDAPVAVTALDTELLEQRQVENVADLNFNVPKRRPRTSSCPRFTRTPKKFPS